MGSNDDEKKTPASAPRIVDGREGRDERPSKSWTLDEVANVMLDGFKNTMGAVADVAREVDTFKIETGARFDELDDRVELLESHILSNPPPPPGAPPATGTAGIQTPRVAARIVAPRPRTRSLPAIAAKTEATEGKTSELEGRILRLEGLAKDANAKADTNLEINKHQARHMGLAMPDAPFWDRAGKFLWSPEGAKFMVLMLSTFLAGVASIYGMRAHDEATRAHEDAQRAAERPPVIVAPSPAGSILVAPAASSR